MKSRYDNEIFETLVSAIVKKVFQNFLELFWLSFRSKQINEILILLVFLINFAMKLFLPWRFVDCMQHLSYLLHCSPSTYKTFVCVDCLSFYSATTTS